MSIRLKLLLSYAAMLIIPLVLIIMITMLLVVVFRGDLQNIREMYRPKADIFKEQRHDNRLMREIKRTAETNPALFADRDYMEEMSQELKNAESGLIVRKDERLTYVSELLQQPELLDRLPGFHRPGDREEELAEGYGSRLYDISRYDFLFPDQHPGSIFIVNQVNPVKNFAHKFFPILFISLIVILVLTHTLLTYFVSRSIIGPLQLLKKAAKQIKEGNLNLSSTSCCRK